MIFKDFSLREWVSVCARCKSFAAPIRVYCEDCWQQLFEIQNTKSELLQPHYPFAVYSLFTWREAHDNLIRPLIYALKGGIVKKVWFDFANDFLFLKEIENKPMSIILPPREKLMDHAYRWGTALAHQMQIEVQDCLGFEGPTANQKSLSRVERQKRKFVLKEAFDFEDQKLIFVDDTITSGGTAYAAYDALDYPSDFEVWTLVSRPRHGTQ